MSATENLLVIEGVEKSYRTRAGGQRALVHAVDGVDLAIAPGEILGLVGESGSGKSTLAELIVGLQSPTAGRVVVDGEDVARLKGKALKAFRRQAQMVFQDPYGTLNPRFTARQTVAEPALIAGMRDRATREEKVRLALSRAGLDPTPTLLDAYPHELSGGQRQRVAIARAIVMEPRLLVADEPVSMLDVSIRSGILNLLLDLRERLGLTIVYISHDLASVDYICDRIAIMYLGKLVETGPTDEIVNRPRHPYTRALLASVPSAEPENERAKTNVGEEAMSAVHLPSGCRFAPRCAFATDECTVAEPELTEQGTAHLVRCVHPRTEPLWEQ